MISTNALSVFIFHQHHNLIWNKNLHSIQEIMCVSDLANENYKKVHDDSPNLIILIKSVTSGKVQLMFAHASFRNKSLGESLASFSLVGSLDSPSVVSVDVNISFTMDGDKIRLPTSELLLRAT